MLERLKLAGNSMVNRMMELDTVSNNLANQSTSGFKRDKVFVNELQRQMQRLQAPQATSAVHVPILNAVVDFSQGALEGTDNPFDLAISGDGLFVVETPQGEAFTRDGRFTLNVDGVLTTLDGNAVMGEGGPVEIDMQQNSPTQLMINDSGEIVLNNSVIDTLRIVSAQNPQDFVKIGSNMFQRAPGAAEPGPAEGFAVKQGFLEDSNVNALEEMVALMDILHQFQVAEKAVKTEDSVLNRAVNDIGRVV
jgi:flagellar basal-body rod protein FlgG